VEQDDVGRDVRERHEQVLGLAGRLERIRELSTYGPRLREAARHVGEEAVLAAFVELRDGRVPPSLERALRHLLGGVVEVLEHEVGLAVTHDPPPGARRHGHRLELRTDARGSVLSLRHVDAVHEHAGAGAVRLGDGLVDDVEHARLGRALRDAVDVEPQRVVGEGHARRQHPVEDGDEPLIDDPGKRVGRALSDDVARTDDLEELVVRELHHVLGPAHHDDRCRRAHEQRAEALALEPERGEQLIAFAKRGLLASFLLLDVRRAEDHRRVAGDTLHHPQRSDQPLGFA